MAAAEEDPGYFFVGYVQAHGLIPKLPYQVQTRTEGPQYLGIGMRVLSIPGDQYISGMMGPMNWPPCKNRHWLGKSTDLVIPGILRNNFKGQCDNPVDINEAFRNVITELKEVYAAARIEFPGGGFTVQDNPPDNQWWQLHGNPGENRRKTPSGLFKRAAADCYQPVISNAYGIFCVCTNHPILKHFCLTALEDKVVEQETHAGETITDIIDSKFFPQINMIGHDNAFEPGPLGAANWISAIEQSKTDPGLQQKAIAIINKEYIDKSLHSQQFITVLQALGIRHAWLVNPTCRDLTENMDPIGERSPSPLRHPYPVSITPTPLGSRAPSPVRARSLSPPPPSSAGGGGRSWRDLFNPFGFFKAPTATPASASASASAACPPRRRSRSPQLSPYPLSQFGPYGGSRKSRKRTTHAPTPTRRKITRKTKKRAYKRKSQKRNTRK